jgi:hypothetical protein
MMSDFWRMMRVPTGFLNEIGRAWLKDLATTIADRFDDPVFVNIGVGKGVSMHCLRAGALDARLVGVDIRSPWSLRTQNVELLNAEFIIAPSAECWQEFDVVHLLFIDGSNAEDDVRADLAGWIPKVVVGGVVVWRCYGLPAPRWNVTRPVDKWAAENVPEFWEDVPVRGGKQGRAFERKR